MRDGGHVERIDRRTLQRNVALGGTHDGEVTLLAGHQRWATQAAVRSARVNDPARRQRVELQRLLGGRCEVAVDINHTLVVLLANTLIEPC